MSTTTSSEYIFRVEDVPAELSFRMWDFSTIDGGGFAVLRAAWCAVTQRSTVDQVAAYYGPEWHGTSSVLHGRRISAVEAEYRARYSVTVEIRRCGCGCLTGVAP